MKVNASIEWRMRRVGQYDLICDNDCVATMIIQLQGSDRSAKIFQGDKVLYIATKGWWLNQTAMVNETGQFLAGFKQDAWSLNRYVFVSPNQQLEILWMNEEQHLVVYGQNGVCLNLQYDPTTGVEIKFKDSLDLDLLYLSWFFFEPVAAAINHRTSLYAIDCG